MAGVQRSFKDVLQTSPTNRFTGRSRRSSDGSILPHHAQSVVCSRSQSRSNPTASRRVSVSMSDANQSPSMDSESEIPVIGPGLLPAQFIKNIPLYHNPLHYGTTIRVLAIQPGDFNDAIVCNFRFVDLSEDEGAFEPFDALSYVWNAHLVDYNRKDRVAVICSGHEKQITANLEDALKHIRSKDLLKLLWVDALCINQSDNDERSHQVSLMGSIYSAAHRVIIWVSEREFNDSWYSERYPEDYEDVRAQRAFGAICDIVNRWKRNGLEKQCASYSSLSPDHRDRVTFTTFEDSPRSAKASTDSLLINDALAYQFGPNGFERIPVPEHGIDSSPDQARTSRFWLSIEDLFARSWFCESRSPLNTVAMC